MSSLLISSQSIQKSYGSHQLFSNISLGFSEKERLGLIGPNGSGKSTLLKIFADIESPDSGSISARNGMHLVYLAQQDSFDENQSIESELLKYFPKNGSDAERHLYLQQAQEQYGFENISQNIQELSGGWRKRLSIACAFMQNPDLVLMDEPTNHLDLEGVLWLESLLKNARFAYVLVSHDRYFLEATTNRIVELNKRYPKGFLKTEGSYSQFLQDRETFIHEQQQQEIRLSNKVRREVEWLQRGPKARTSKAQYRIDQAAAMQSELAELKYRNDQERSAQVEFDASQRKTKKLVEGKQLGMAYGDKSLFQKLDVLLSPGKCLGLIGQNGSGKSTLIHLLNGSLEPQAGHLWRADALKMVTFDQKREQLDPQQTLRQALSPNGDHVMYQGRSLHIVAWAQRFLFSKEQLGLPLHMLSGGEQARVLIANLMQQPSDILLLDEPTNDLDIPTLEVLEESLQEYPGALVLITHDRFLLDRLSDEVLYLDGKGSHQYYADYSQWEEHQSSALNTSNTPNKANKKNKDASNSSNKRTYAEQKELGKIEKKIQKAEEVVVQLQDQMQDPDVATNPSRLEELYAQVEEAEQAVNTLYARWEELEAKD